MIFPDVSYIKVKRKEIGITQKQLSSEARVSQSLIAKLESGKAEASYEKVKRIFETFDRLARKNEKKASEIMTKEIISVKPNNKVKEAINKIKSHNISQLPVFSNGKQVGSISEKGIISKLEEIPNIHEKLIKEIIEEPFPTINKEIPVRALISILKEVNAVLVLDKSIPVGIISRSDMI